MKWLVDRDQIVRPLLSFQLNFLRAPPENWFRSIWGVSNSIECPGLKTSHPDSLLFLDVPNTGSGTSLWLDMRKSFAQYRMEDKMFGVDRCDDTKIDQDIKMEGDSQKLHTSRLATLQQHTSFRHLMNLRHPHVRISSPIGNSLADLASIKTPQATCLNGERNKIEESSLCKYQGDSKENTTRNIPITKHTQNAIVRDATPKQERMSLGRRLLQHAFKQNNSGAPNYMQGIYVEDNDPRIPIQSASTLINKRRL